MIFTFEGVENLGAELWKGGAGKQEGASSKQRSTEQKSQSEPFTFLLIIFLTLPLQDDCTNEPPRWELFPKPLRCRLPALSGILPTIHPFSNLLTSVTCSVSGTGDLAPLDWMTYRSVLIWQEKSYDAFLTSEIGSSVQPIAPVKGATLVEEEFMEEEKVKSEIYVYYMKTVGEFNKNNNKK